MCRFARMGVHALHFFFIVLLGIGPFALRVKPTFVFLTVDVRIYREASEVEKS